MQAERNKQMEQQIRAAAQQKSWRAGWGVVMADTEEISSTSLSIPAGTVADYCFQNSGTCTECGGGMMRLGACFVCGVCGSGGCEGG
jgi:hypothetical protein